MPKGMLRLNDRRGPARAGAGGRGHGGGGAAPAARLLEYGGDPRPPHRVHRGGRLSSLLRIRHLDAGHPAGRPASAAPPPLPPCPGELRRGVAQGAHGTDALQQSRDGGHGGRRQDHHLHALRLRRRVLRLPRAHGVLLDDLRHPHAARARALDVHLRGHRHARLDQYLPGADRAPHGLGHRDLSLPPVLPDHSQRARGGGPARRRRAHALPLPIPAPVVVGEYRRPLRGALHLRLEPVPLAAPHHQYRDHADGGDRARGADPAQRHRAAHVEPHHGGGSDGAPAPRGHHHLHAALVREGPRGEREVRSLLVFGWVAGSVGILAAMLGAEAAPTAPTLLAAHRGGSLLWPENSPLAFRNALALGADFIEFDVHLARDGEVVVIHDATLDRTTTGSGPVRDRTVAELKALRLTDRSGAVTPETVPTLDEVVDAAAVAQAQRAGIGLGAWTVNDPADMTRVIGAGVTILITDQPDVAKTLLKR